MLVFKVAALLLMLLGPAVAQLTIDPNVIFDPENPVCVTLDLDNYTRVLVREETTVKIDCSFVRTSFIARNTITDESRVSVIWMFAGQAPNLVDFMRPATSLPTDSAITIRGQFNEIVNNTGVRLPTLAVDGTTGEYTCEVCSDRGMPTETCSNSTVPIIGRRFPPVIDEGEPNEVCPVTPFFNFVTCMVGTNYCIPPTLPNQIILLCQHSPPPTPVTPNPQIGVWFLNGVQISDDEGTANPEAPSAITLTQQGRRLAIPSPAMAPLGNYTCMLTNIAGFDVSTTIISTCVPPVLQPPRRDDPSTIQIGFTPHCLTTPQTTILCELQSGSPVITYSWTRNGAAISGETSDRLTITETGTYNCTATNVVNSTSASTVVAEGAMIAFNGDITGRTDNGCGRLTSPSARNPDICVLIGETLTFTCTPDGGAPEATTPQITDPASMQVTTGSMTIVQPTSDGMFRCSSSAGQCGTTMTIDVQVFDPPMIDMNIALPTQPNTITGGAGRMNITTPSGSTVRLFCPSTGRPPAMITWQRRVGGNLVAVDPASVTATMVGVLPAALLTLTNVQGADFAEYVCTATNVVGMDTEDITLMPAGSPPVIDEATPTPGPPTGPAPENNIRIGDKACIPANGNVRINCNTLSGSTPLTYEWRRDGILITNPTPPTSLTVSQAGMYRCMVSNRFDSDSATSQIQVTPASVNFQITSNAPINCSRLNPQPANIDRCPRFARVDFRCTSDQGLPTQIAYNGAPFSQSFIDPFGTANDGRYSCSAATSCGMASSDLTVQAFEPAQVDVDVPLPPPDISGSIPGGAGRGPVGVPVGGNVTLFCPTTGVDLPTTRWEINRVAVVSMPPRIVVGSRNVNGQIFLTLTITNISASDQITYTCVTMNADGTDRQDVIVREPPRNEWCLGTWSTCTPDCHRGTRNRTVVCKDNARRVLSDLSCSPPKPAQTATCDTRGPCFLSPVWRHGDWTQCTRQCGTGSRTRPVDCIIPRTTTIVDDGQCVHIVRPKSFQLCNTRDCCITDRYASWCRLISGSPFCNMDAFKQVCCWTCGGT